MAFEYQAIMDVRPPAKRKDPPHSEMQTEQGKPIVLPGTAGELRGTLLVLWVDERGKSEGSSVMAEIQAGTLLDAQAGRLPRGHVWRENLINRCTQENR